MSMILVIPDFIAKGTDLEAEIFSIQFSGQPGGSTGGQSGTAGDLEHLKDVYITLAATDKIIKLYKSAQDGVRIDTLRIEVFSTKNNATTMVATYALENVFISGYSINGSGAKKPLVELTLNIEKITQKLH